MNQGVKRHHKPELEKLSVEVTELRKQLQIKGKNHFRNKAKAKRNIRANKYNSALKDIESEKEEFFKRNCFKNQKEMKSEKKPLVHTFPAAPEGGLCFLPVAASQPFC